MTVDGVVHAAAQQARTKPWTPNPGGARSLDEAIEFARSHGIVIEDDVRFVVHDALLRDDEDARWGAFKSTQSYAWEEPLDRG